MNIFTVVQVHRETGERKVLPYASQDRKTIEYHAGYLSDRLFTFEVVEFTEVKAGHHG